jgi:hypothetical protein
MNFRNWVAGVTHSVRYGIVKVIAPTLYKRNKDYIEGDIRSTIRFVMDVMGNAPLIGAEIGVSIGVNAESIMKTLNMKKLYLVDPYEPYVEDGFSVKFALTEGQKEIAAKRLKRFGERIEWFYQTSDRAAPLIPNGLDFVYIDGNHTYEYVKQDIADYFPKIKEKGVIGGHDFGKYYLGLIRAVTEFSVNNSLELMVDRDDWWVMKK